MGIKENQGSIMLMNGNNGGNFFDSFYDIDFWQLNQFLFGKLSGMWLQTVGRRKTNSTCPLRGCVPPLLHA